MSEDGDRPTPAMWDHVQLVFNEMEKRSTIEQLAGEPVKVYEGHLTGLFQELGIPNPYYTHIMKALKAMGCVDQIRRGGGAAYSKWQLCYPPTEEGFMTYDDNRLPNRAKGKIGALEQRVKLLDERVTYMERFLSKAKEVA